MPVLPINATFPASDPDMTAVTDVYANHIVEEMLLCGARSMRWSDTVSQMLEFDMERASPDQQKKIVHYKTPRAWATSDTNAMCDDVLYHPVYADLIASLDAAVVMANND